MVSRLVALDLDGTVVSYDESIDPGLREALQTLDADPETEVIIATGRGVDSTIHVAEELGIEPTWLVSANGAVTVKRDETMPNNYRREHTVTFQPREMLLSIRGHLSSAQYAVEDGEGNIWHAGRVPYLVFTEHREVSFEELMDLEATRVVVASPDHGVEEFLQLVEGIGLHSVNYAIGHTAWLDVAPQGVSKATALMRVNERLGVSAENIFACGDGDNDRDMLTWAGASGRAAVMGQATAEVKAAGNYMTGSIDENGLLTALRDWHPLLSSH